MLAQIRFRGIPRNSSTEMNNFSNYHSTQSTIYGSAVSFINGQHWVVVDEIRDLGHDMEDDIFEFFDHSEDEPISGISRSTIGLKTYGELRKDHEDLLKRLTRPQKLEAEDLLKPYESLGFITTKSFSNGIDYPGKPNSRNRYIDIEIVEFNPKKENPIKKAFDMIASAFRFLFMSCYSAPPRIQALRPGRDCDNPEEIPGEAVRIYVDNLTTDKSTVFAQSLDNFISCTKESKETDPHVVMRNIRQFMSGMKNYLVKHGEREFEKVVEKERLKLRSNEFLNLDSILEIVLHSRVVSPLRSHVYTLLADKFYKRGDINLLKKGMQITRILPALRLGIRPSVRLPSETELFAISGHFLKMQEADSPMDKLDYLLTAISAIFNSMKLGARRGSQAFGADDFLPVLVHTIAQCSIPGAELEAETMAGLLPPPMLQGEAGYYLTTLFGAVAVLKKIATHDPNVPDEWKTSSLTSNCNSSSNSSNIGTGGVTRVLVPDESAGALRRIALPWRPGARSRDLCRALAHRTRITNPQDYGLFVLKDGEETLLLDGDCPQDIVSSSKYSNCMLAYKRIDAKIAWPKQAFSYPS